MNLTLDILGKREDGYHDLRMVMQSITLADTLTLEENQGEGLRVSANLHFLPTGEKNLAAAAALRFWEALGREPENLDIRIEKRIPVCAGMAGGSSDAAAVLRALNRRAGEPFSPRELAKIGERVGSDVPYCVLGGTALAEGRGEMLTPLAPLPRCWVVACKPDFPISTPELFAQADRVKLRRRPDTAGLVGQHERQRPHRLRPVRPPGGGPGGTGLPGPALPGHFFVRDGLKRENTGYSMGTDT